MAHKLFDIKDDEGKKKKTQFRIPRVSGKFGFAFFIGEQEVFIGITIFPVILEQVVRRRLLKTPKKTTRVFNFD